MEFAAVAYGKKPIENGKWIYHLTSIENLESVLVSGLLSRRDLTGQKRAFKDIADQEILEGREAFKLDTFVPFHFFSGNPFDGRVQKMRPTERFFYVCVNRTLAEQRGYKILPTHPLAKSQTSIYDYREGFSQIDWEKMNSRNYLDSEIKSICMAECLSPAQVPLTDFNKLVFSCDKDEALALKIARGQKLQIATWINDKFFIRN